MEASLFTHENTNISHPLPLTILLSSTALMDDFKGLLPKKTQKKQQPLHSKKPGMWISESCQ